MTYPYNGPNLIEQLEIQHEARGKSELFRKGVCKLTWRTTVGSFPHPDGETLVPAGEPCGAWLPEQVTQNRGRRGREKDIITYPEDPRNIDENLQGFPTLPLNGYIPASSIRGIVREWVTAWSKTDRQLQHKVDSLLGYQRGERIQPGKVEFLDAWPIEETPLSLDIVNPQSEFQISHTSQAQPHSCYSLGHGDELVEFLVALRGVPGQATAEDVQTVWSWLQHALMAYGIGGRIASGYGSVDIPGFQPEAHWSSPIPHTNTYRIHFTLCSQGNAGPDMGEQELRPTHWRGWLRSWLMRFFLGVMSEDNAKYTVSELMGTLEDSADGTSQKGIVQIKLINGNIWKKRSHQRPYFYTWRGVLEITAEGDLWHKILMPIIRFAAMVGGVGKGSRRPLHIFHDPKHTPRARGCHVVLQLEGRERRKIPLGIKPTFEDWEKVYSSWQAAVENRWPNRYELPRVRINAEVFSPRHCSVYSVPGPVEEPIDIDAMDWLNPQEATETRGEGMRLIYKNPYKRNPNVGGDAAGNGNAHCSWVSIKRIPFKPKRAGTSKEIVCLFSAISHSDRQSFLRKLQGINQSSHIFGITNLSESN